MELSMRERRAVVKGFADQYRRARKKGKREILDQVAEATGYTRSYASWLLRNHGRKVRVSQRVVLVGDATKMRRRRARPKLYGPEVQRVLRKLWIMLDFISSRRLAAALPIVIPALERFRELRLEPQIREQLVSISPATIDRLLARDRRRTRLRSRSLTKPGSLLKHQIPIRTFADWDNARPGFIEMDLVGHDGGNPSGDFCQTLDMTDVSTGWTELVAVKNKAQVWVFEALQEASGRLPFPLLGLDSDNGSEFINSHLKAFCDKNKVTFTRARPYRKNDTCYVEQKNWSVVRRFVGYQRFDTEEELMLLNEFYSVLRFLTNFFLPSQKLLEKTRDGAKVTRRYDQARTPCQRVLESPHVSEEVKQRLSRMALELNPAELNRQVSQFSKRIIQMADAKARRAHGAARYVGSAVPAGKASGFPTGTWRTPSEFPTPPTSTTTARVE